MTLYIVSHRSTIIFADSRWSAWIIAKDDLNISNPVLMRLSP